MAHFCKYCGQWSNQNDALLRIWEALQGNQGDDKGLLWYIEEVVHSALNGTSRPIANTTTLKLD